MSRRQPSRPKLDGCDKKTREWERSAQMLRLLRCQLARVGISGGGAEEEGGGRAAPVLPLVASIRVSPGFSVPSFSASDIMLSAGLYRMHTQHVDTIHICIPVLAKTSK